ncbi:MAG: GNAT family N-acetyltransferase [Planctomycetota bacterium]|nr:GNAT family N-acetyltransferase [Planctomycetota bacterium]
MTYLVRDLDPDTEHELDTVTRWSMETVLETIPEFSGSEAVARSVLPNFSFDEMRAMFEADLERPSHRFLVVEHDAHGLVGHSMISRKRDAEGLRFGYFFTRFVLPAHRRKGLGSRLLGEALRWFDEEGWDYLLAHTHAANEALQALFARHGFTIVERTEKPWAAVTLRRDAGP